MLYPNDCANRLGTTADGFHGTGIGGWRGKATPSRSPQARPDRCADGGPHHEIGPERLRDDGLARDTAREQPYGVLALLGHRRVNAGEREGQFGGEGDVIEACQREVLAQPQARRAAPTVPIIARSLTAKIAVGRSVPLSNSTAARGRRPCRCQCRTRWADKGRPAARKRLVPGPTSRSGRLPTADFCAATCPKNLEEVREVHIGGRLGRGRLRALTHQCRGEEGRSRPRAVGATRRRMLTYSGLHRCSPCQGGSTSSAQAIRLAGLHRTRSRRAKASRLAEASHTRLTDPTEERRSECIRPALSGLHGRFGGPRDTPGKLVAWICR